MYTNNIKVIIEWKIDLRINFLSTEYRWKVDCTYGNK